jgi:hypothetical protein
VPRATSPVDQYLAEQASKDGYPTSPRQIERWRHGGILPLNERRFSGHGSTSIAAAGAAELVSWLSRNAGRGRRPSDLALLAFAEGLAVPESTVRSAFAAAARRVGILIEDRMPDSSSPEDVANAAVGAGLSGTILPDRVRQIDQSLSALDVDWAPPGVGELDPGPRSEPLTPGDWTYNTVLALLSGGGELTVEQMGQMARSVLPRTAAAPFATDMEASWPGNDAEREVLLNEAGGFSFLPAGDVRQHFEGLAQSLPLTDLYQGWQSAVQLAHWSQRLCADVEAEIASNSLGPSALEWMVGAAIGPARTLMTIGLRDAVASPSDLAFSAFLLVFMRDLMRDVRTLVPDGAFEYLDLPGVLPPCLHTMLCEPNS